MGVVCVVDGRVTGVQCVCGGLQSLRQDQL